MINVRMKDITDQKLNLISFIKVKLWNQKGFTFFLILLALIASNLSTKFIGNYYIIRYVNPDLVFSLFPSSIYLEYFSDILVYFGILIFLSYYARKHKEKITGYINSVSIMYILHSIIKIFTPMMRPTGVDLPSHGVFRDVIPQLGMFPSGHVGLVSVLYYLIDGEKDPRFKKLFLFIVVLECITMVISRGHYSIDVIGGVLLAYFVVTNLKVRKLV